jgi:methyl-accepting chemotaxis protein
MSILISFAVLCMVILTIGFMYFLNNTLIEDKKGKTRNVVESIYGILDYYHGLVESGAMTEDAAKGVAMATVKKLRYDEKEYFWINDDKLPYPTVIMHPTVPAMDGKVADAEKFNCATSMQAGNGPIVKTDGKKNLFQAFVEIANNAGSGFVTYEWPKPIAGGGVSKETYPKLSYVKKYQPWGWIVGSGIYIDDIQKEFMHKLLLIALALLIITVLMLSIGWFISKAITSPLSEVNKKIESMAHGDLTVTVDYTGGDEAGILAANINTMIGSFKNTISSILSSASEVVSSVSTLKSGSERATEGAREQSMQASQIATAAEEMSQTITDISRNASVASDTSHEAMQTAEIGKEVADGAVTTINEVHASTGQLAEMINKLNARASEIGGIVTVIKEIADQTNLLALNAAIEAARAGEQGRGFAVVADEVRKLSERTIKATAEITEKIGAVQVESKKTMQSMSESSEKVEQATNFIQQVGESLGHIVDSVQRARDQIVQIATAVEEQSSASEEVTLNIEKTSHIAGDMEKMASDVMEEVNKLSLTAETLRVSAAGFSVEKGNASGTGDFIQWTPSYSVNIKLIDEQHKQLMKLINDMHKAMQGKKSKETVGRILNELLDYTAKHFKVEEDWFQQYQYPDYTAHKDIHNKLIKSALDMKARFEKGDRSVNVELMSFLKNWLSDHILRTDKKYSAFLNSKGIE